MQQNLEFKTSKKRIEVKGKYETIKSYVVFETILTQAKVRTHHHLLSMVIAQQECLQANRQKLKVCSEPEANGGLQPNVNMRNWWIEIEGPQQVQLARAAVSKTGGTKDQGQK